MATRVSPRRKLGREDLILKYLLQYECAEALAIHD